MASKKLISSPVLTNIEEIEQYYISTILCLTLVAEEYRQKMTSKKLLSPPLLSNIEEIGFHCCMI